jgi:K+-transporting ATPase ATPase A chain
MSQVLTISWLQLCFYFAVLLTCVKPLGTFIAKVYENEKHILNGPLGWLERVFYKLSGVKPSDEMNWKTYALHTIVFSIISFLVLYALLRLQNLLPLNPAKMSEVSPDLAFNTAVSFITNTNWQSYGGEATMSYASQMIGLTLQNFLSAAVGMAVMVALIRGFVRRNSTTIGNFWTDLVRGVLYIFLPLSLVLAIILGAQGVVQNFKPYADAQLMETLHVDVQKDADGKVTQPAQTLTTQSIATGPVASQIAIKQLGTNGGGFFNANSAHPFENPTPVTNFLEMLAILLIPAALCYTFGYMIRDTRQGWALLITMMIILVPLLLGCLDQEQRGNPHFASLGIDQTASHMQSGGNMEGKETRFGIINSVIWAATTTAASNGSVNSMHDSYTPLGGLVPMFLIQCSEVVFGGVGSGLYGMFMFVLVAVFIAGLMVGRTPEYLGKKIQSFEIKMASLAILISPMAVLLGAAIAAVTTAGKAGVLNPAAQGFSEILYAFTSAGNNNGSAFAGISANTPFYNIALGIVMLFGRYWIIIPVLAIAGSLAAKNTVPQSAGTLVTHTPLFISLLVGVILMVGVLTYAPAFALGPIAEHFAMLNSIK